MVAPTGPPPAAPVAPVAPVGPVAAGPHAALRSRRAVRLRPVAIGLLLLAVLAGIVAIGLRSSVLGMLAVAVAGVIALDVATARRALARVQLRISNPVLATLGEAVPFVLDVRGLSQPLVLIRPGSWPGPASLTIGLRRGGPGTVLVDEAHRGVRTEEIVDVVAPGPLGLGEAAVRERLVFPVPLHVAAAPTRHSIDWRDPRTVPLGEATTVTRGDELFRGVRPYVRGDTRRSIHWPATAHHGTLMVKERDGLEQVALRVVVDLPRPGPDAEAAVARAAWLVEYGVARGWLVQLVTTTGPPPPPLPLGRPWTAVPRAWGPMVATETAVQRITRAADGHVQLAAAGVGRPTVEPWPGLTRVVTPEGDRWT